jgi:hypothetical protein
VPTRARYEALHEPRRVPHPEYSAPRVLKELGPKYGVSLVWVRQVLHDFWQTSAKHNPEQRRIGRRCYGHFHPFLR